LEGCRGLNSFSAHSDILPYLDQLIPKANFTLSEPINLTGTSAGRHRHVLKTKNPGTAINGGRGRK
jgi:hypothetical protein